MALDGSPGPEPPTPSGPAPGADWAGQTTDTIVRIVEQVRDRTTVPLLTASRGLVFGLLAGIIAIAVLTLAFVMVVRILDIVLPSGVWVAYLVLGLVLVVAGAILMRKRRSTALEVS
jgi:uncharacterized protein YacL